MKTIQVSDDFVESLRNIAAELRHARQTLPAAMPLGTTSQIHSAIGAGIAAIETILWGIDKSPTDVEEEKKDG